MSHFKSVLNYLWVDTCVPQLEYRRTWRALLQLAPPSTFTWALVGYQAFRARDFTCWAILPLQIQLLLVLLLLLFIYSLCVSTYMSTHRHEQKSNGSLQESALSCIVVLLHQTQAVCLVINSLPTEPFHWLWSHCLMGTT